MQTLYQLHWVYPIVFPKTRVLVVAQTRKTGKHINIIDRVRQGVPGAIMYPALLTPEVVVKGQSIEFLMLTKERFADKAKLVEYINWQLKIIEGMDPLREYNSDPLFEKGKLTDLIKVHADWNIGPDLVKTGAGGKGRFWGRLDTRAVETYEKNGFKYLYSVEVDAKAIEASKPRESPVADLRRWPNGRGIGLFKSKQNSDQQDWVLWKTIENKQLMGIGRYNFVLKDDDARVGPVNFKNPILAFHPLIVREELEYANLAHMGDIHVTSRQQFLAASEAKVIHAPGQPTVGSLVNSCSARVKTLFDKFSGDSEVDAIIVGGDFGDYLRTMYTADLHDDGGTRRPMSVQTIWDLTAIEKGNIPNYTDFPDFITVYSFIVDAYRKAGKPVFAITGNHDAYSFPFGVSPRPIRDGEASKKGNEGIPADHNMTIYECILSQGPTYGTVVTDPAISDPLNCMLLPRRFLWFYSAFTPWADYVVHLPKQIIVAMAWGDGESMISLANWEQGLGHLPRSVKGMSDDQLAMLKEVIKENTPSAPGGQKNVILTTHFTFASFAEKFPENDARAAEWGEESDGHIFYKVGKTPGKRDVYSEYDMGTFELNREEMYKKVIMDGRASGRSPIQIILTGHSHRRALYTFREAFTPTFGSDSVLADFTDFPKNFDSDPRLLDAKGNPRREPWVILSDSGGPVPRMNKLGEFRGWGSDEPAGTKIVFSGTGDPHKVEAVKTGLKPRFAVSMDYFDIIVLRTGGNSFTDWKDDVVIKSWESDYAALDANGGLAGELTFTLKFHDEFAKTVTKHADDEWGLAGKNVLVYDGLFVESISLFMTPGGGAPDHGTLEAAAQEVRLEKVGGAPLTSLSSKWKVRDPAALRLLARHFEGVTKRVLFASIKFGARSGTWWEKTYDFSTAWNFEIEVAADFKKNFPLLGKKTGKKYEITRHHVEIPSFDDRLTMFKYAALGASPAH
jgi:hypothetical protein